MTSNMWHSISVDDTMKILNCTADGLTKLEAANRLRDNGPNKLSEGARRTLAHMIWEQLYNIITCILIVSAIISGLFHEWIELGFIMAVVVVNVAIGVIQEGKAEAATNAIKKMVSAESVVKRNGRNLTVSAADLVTGDLIMLNSGDRIPADVRFIECFGVEVTESMLTGESHLVTKSSSEVAADAPLAERYSMGYSGTLIVAGTGKAIIVATGDQAELGRINMLMVKTKLVKTPLLKQVEQFGFSISLFCILLAVVTFVVAYWARNMPLHEAFEACISVAVALIPEGLPTVVTITLALGVQTLAKKKTITRQLMAVETLGALTCICSDKTGTLTKNEMTAVTIQDATGVYRVTGSGYAPTGHIKFLEKVMSAEKIENLKQLLLPAVLCNDATVMPTLSAVSHQMIREQPLTLPPAQLFDQKATDSVNPQLPMLQKLSSQAELLAASEGASALEWETTGDPTEASLLVLAMKAGLNLRTLRHLSVYCPRLTTRPFSSETKFMATVHSLAHPLTGIKHNILMVKGAPDVLFARCTCQASGSPWEAEPLDLTMWLETNRELAGEGKRVLAMCWADIGNMAPGEAIAHLPPLQLNCLIAIVDPPRDEVPAAVRACRDAGIMVKMITGDNEMTARTIAKWIGLDTQIVLRGADLQAMTDVELEQKVEECCVFARTSPEHKLRIVKALQAKGHIVAMTGDGVNDAPALRQANVGVGMGITGTEVAKEAARVILQDDNFATIVAAVEQGRCTYDNLRKLMMFLLPTSFAQGISIAIAVFIDIQEPLTAIQILSVNMLTAATLGLVLAAETPEPGVMSRQPRKSGKPLVGLHITWRTLCVGTMMIVAMLVQQGWTHSLGGSRQRGHSMAMNTLVISQCLYCLSCRHSQTSTISFGAVVSNPWLTAMVLGNVAFQCLITYTPGLQEIWYTEAIDGIDWLRILAFALVIYLAVEFEKVMYFRIRPYLKLVKRKRKQPVSNPIDLPMPNSSTPDVAHTGQVTVHIANVSCQPANSSTAPFTKD